MGAKQVYYGGSFVEDISITQFVFLLSSQILPKKAYHVEVVLYFRGSVTTISLQTVQQRLRLTGWWAVRGGKRTLFTLTTGQRIKISLRFNMEAL